jgi:ParB family chromosome partitioning protein
MPLQLDDLAGLDAPSPTASGEPLQLPVADIDEDPEQPRHEFDANALQELAATIRERGVRQPISVRPHLQAAGRWVLNFGARRLRASKLAGLDTIPAFVDTTADRYDQVIENEQREGLKPLELALFVQKRLALGDRQADIARQLGRSRQWVTLATALIEAPDWLLQAYREGRCRGMNELYELRRLHGEHAGAVEAWTARERSITRDRLAALRAELSATVAPDPSEATRPGTPPQPVRQAESPVEMDESRSPRSTKRIHVEFDGQDYQLVVSVAPEQSGHVYVRPLVGGPRRLAPAASLKLLGFVGA